MAFAWSFLKVMLMWGDLGLKVWPWTSGICIAREPRRNADFWVPPRPIGSETGVAGTGFYTVKFESYIARLSPLV